MALTCLKPPPRVLADCCRPSPPPRFEPTMSPNPHDRLPRRALLPAALLSSLALLSPPSAFAAADGAADAKTLLHPPADHPAGNPAVGHRDQPAAPAGRIAVQHQRRDAYRARRQRVLL
ncbi:hypothetical protein G6F59_016662 [Rhizopus arrhizus]|nr:hypothetical protein G6F59_016662 [Rhizopus arrhizus]